MKKLSLLLAAIFLFSQVSLSAAPMTVQQANNFTSILNAYRLVDTDEASATTKYYGFTKYDGYWYIMKEAISSDVHTYTFVTGTSAYSTAWTGRAGLTYGTFTAIMSEPI